MSKKIVITSRGVRLDMDALKRSQPQATKIVAGKKRTTVKPVTQKTSMNRPYVARVHATVPSPLPKPETRPKVEVVKKVEKPVPIKVEPPKSEPVKVEIAKPKE